MKKHTLLGLVALLTACAAPIDPAPEITSPVSPRSPGGADPAPTQETSRAEATLQSAERVWEKRPPIRSRRWREGERVELARPSSSCEVRRWGEWFRIECAAWASEVAQLAGPVAGMEIAGRDSDAERYIVFPTAARAKRVFQLGSVFGGWRMPWSTSVDAIISVDWEEGARDPIVSIN